MFKDSKLFGKINVIDLFIVLALIGAAAFGIYQLRAGQGVAFIAPPETREFIISFYTEEVENFSAHAVNIGDNVFDHGRNISLGVVTDIEIADAIIWNADQYGNTVRSNKDGFSSIEIFARLSATPTEHGIIIAGNRYGIGHSLAVRAGMATIFMRISGLEEIT
jgi:hypothetical protein